jgi:hypothetical protein
VVSGKSHEIRVFGDNGKHSSVYSVAGFLENRMITNGYAVTMNTDFDFENLAGTWGYERMIAVVMQDIEEGRVIP